MPLKEQDRTVLRDVIKKTSLERCKALLTQYFKMDGSRKDDDWFKGKGHDLHTFERNLSTINAALGSMNKNIVYVVAVSKDGVPTCSYNPEEMGPGKNPDTLEAWTAKNVDTGSQ